MDKSRILAKYAKNRIELGGKLEKIGMSGDKEVWICTFKNPITIGYPEIYLWDGYKVDVINGEDALDYIS